MKVRRATIPKSTNGNPLPTGNYLLTIGETGRASVVLLNESESQQLAVLMGRS